MNLTLEIIGDDAAKLGAGRRKVFRDAGGTIGRQLGSDWVLPPELCISNKHAKIRFADGRFLIEDISSNGMSVNEARLVPREPRALADGDLILIEPFEIRVSITREESPAHPAVRPVAADALSGSLDPINALFGEAPPKSKPDASPARISDPSEAHYAPPSSVFNENLIPVNWWESKPSGASSAEPPLPLPVAAPMPVARQAEVGLAAVLAGAGLTDVTVTPALAESLGRILRVVVSGVMDVLKIRQEIKSEFRLRATIVQKADNNPLKFSANVDDALHNLLVKRNPAYKEPVDAFEDAFDDLRIHQMAMLEGVREAFSSMLDQFDPDQLQKEFDSQARKGSLLPAPAKMRYWDQYRERVRDMVSDADDSFRRLFGDEFGKAYERQLKRLKAQARSGKV